MKRLYTCTLVGPSQPSSLCRQCTDAFRGAPHQIQLWIQSLNASLPKWLKVVIAGCHRSIQSLNSPFDFSNQITMRFKFSDLMISAALLKPAYCKWFNNHSLRLCRLKDSSCNYDRTDTQPYRKMFPMPSRGWSWFHPCIQPLLMIKNDRVYNFHKHYRLNKSKFVTNKNFTRHQSLTYQFNNLNPSVSIRAYS